MNKIAEEEHKQLANWAADCAEHVLLFFEEINPQNGRPRKAIAAARAWIHDEIKMSEARSFAFAAHAAAREANSPASKAAARAAGHAAATVHAASHARYAASYALKASGDAATERAWQWQRLPTHLQALMQSEAGKKMSYK